MNFDKSHSIFEIHHFFGEIPVCFLLWTRLDQIRSIFGYWYGVSGLVFLADGTRHLSPTRGEWFPAVHRHPSHLGHGRHLAADGLNRPALGAIDPKRTIFDPNAFIVLVVFSMKG